MNCEDSRVRAARNGKDAVHLSQFVDISRECYKAVTFSKLLASLFVFSSVSSCGLLQTLSQTWLTRRARSRMLGPSGQSVQVNEFVKSIVCADKRIEGIGSRRNQHQSL